MLFHGLGKPKRSKVAWVWIFKPRGYSLAPDIYLFLASHGLNNLTLGDLAWLRVKLGPTNRIWLQTVPYVVSGSEGGSVEALRNETNCFRFNNNLVLFVAINWLVVNYFVWEVLLIEAMSGLLDCRRFKVILLFFYIDQLTARLPGKARWFASKLLLVTVLCSNLRESQRCYALLVPSVWA